MQIQIPRKLAFLYEPHPFKAAYGGRGGCKSRGFADALTVLAKREKKLILCGREFQNSIRDSVHALLARCIERNGFSKFFDIQQQRIIGKNGSEFIFAGLKHNISNIKSIEEVDIAWVEEAANVSAHTWEVLIPSIRKKGSEIWASFNPELDTDATYKIFVLDPPPGAKVVKINYQDNPWIHETNLLAQIEHSKKTDYDRYLNVWEGHCRLTIDGAVYANEMRKTVEENRIGKVPLLPAKPVETYWDLGKRDHTSIWFVQFNGSEYRIIDFYENRGQNLPHYFKILQDRGYLYGDFWLPHDAEDDRLGSLPINKQFEEIYPGKIKIVPRISNIEAGISAVRDIFPLCHFDELKCADGLQALRRYKFAVDPDTRQYSLKPLHDEYSDSADAFRQIAQSLVLKKEKKSPIKLTQRSFKDGPQGASWMGR